LGEREGQFIGLPRPLQPSEKVLFNNTLVTVQVKGGVLHSVDRQFFVITGLNYHEVLGLRNIVTF